ncbi:uncharacterized protein LDX57_010787 [Aspergillus melleus]|uniref:uncharacterized protein n=1 Tax=Aspergillus melleus TaxID=138277 RepID=UPI001E8DEC7D|nr:uncharacterized protein LDX57_010787 [Aspergillus melleus]KAH8433153.1 hypothetical protein LDX57_010787 [Aspergillus melleus]
MSSVPTATQKDEVFLYMGSLNPNLRCVEYLETIIGLLKSKRFQICRQKPDLSRDELYRVYSIYVDASLDISKQVDGFLPKLIEFLEKNLEQDREDRAKSLEG